MHTHKNQKYCLLLLFKTLGVLVCFRTRILWRVKDATLYLPEADPCQTGTQFAIGRDCCPQLADKHQGRLP